MAPHPHGGRPHVRPDVRSRPVHVFPTLEPFVLMRCMQKFGIFGDFKQKDFGIFGDFGQKDLGKWFFVTIFAPVECL